MKSAACGFCLILFAFPFAAQASENLVAKREACRQEARARIAPKGKIRVDDYRRIVERRTAYVNQCISRSVVAQVAAHDDIPLPPKRVLDDATDANPEPPAVTSPRKEPRRMAGRAERQRPKLAPTRTKGKKLRGRMFRPLSRRSK